MREGGVSGIIPKFLVWLVECMVLLFTKVGNAAVEGGCGGGRSGTESSALDT